MKLLRNNILIIAEKPEEKSKSGLYIKEDWKTVPPLGTVELVGPDVKTVKAGDRVLYNRYAAEKLEYDRQLITELDVNAVLDKDEDINGQKN